MQQESEQLNEPELEKNPYPDDFVKAIRFTLEWEKEEVIEKGRLVAIYGVDRRLFPEVFDELKQSEGNDRIALAFEFYYQVFWQPLALPDTGSWLRIFAFDSAISMGLALWRDKPDDTRGFWWLVSERCRLYNEVAARKANRKYLHDWLSRVFALVDYLHQNP